MFKGSKQTKVSKDRVQDYLDAGWQKGSSTIKICDADGNKTTIKIVELEEALNKGAGFISTHRTKKLDLGQENMVLINNDLTDIYIKKEYLQYFFTHNWKEGTCLVRLLKPNAKHTQDCTYSTRGLMGEKLQKGYTLYQKKKS